MASTKKTGERRGELVVGVDVGTSSARAGVFALDGVLLGHGSSPLQLNSPQPEFHEQSSDDIWEACGAAIRSALESAAADPASVVGLSFDATACSLVALDAGDRPVTVSPGAEDRWNVVLWMDHRAREEAESVNATGHGALKYLGGRISPEMAIPKLRWIKTHLPRSWQRSARFLDLVDFLGYRATGVEARSVCTAVCKWNYLAHEGEGGGRWPRELFASMGLDVLFEREGRGVEVRPLGSSLGPLRADAARALGLVAGVAVGVGIIDAHAGGLGLLGAALGEGEPGLDRAAGRLESALALIGGTSSCHMAVSTEARFVEGIWGPYFSAMIPGMWLTEGGQSATGSLIDHVIEDARASRQLRERAGAAARSVYEILNEELLALGSSKDGGGEGVDPSLTSDLHVLPYFHGNRSPRSDASLRGVISGLSLDTGLGGLARRYLAAVQAVAYGTRHIIESLNEAGFRIDTIFATGGGTRNPVWLQEHADVTGCVLQLPAQEEAVLLGAAVLAAVAAGKYGSVLEAMAAMGAPGEVVKPRPHTREYHEKKYRVFHRMYGHFMELRELMA